MDLHSTGCPALTAPEPREGLLRCDGDVGSLSSQETWDCSLPSYPRAMPRSCRVPGFLGPGAERETGCSSQLSIHSSLSSGSLSRTGGEGGGERAVPGPWKLPGLTLSNLLCSLEQAPSAYFSAPWKADQIFQSRTFPCGESAHPDLSPLGRHIGGLVAWVSQPPGWY